MRVLVIQKQNTTGFHLCFDQHIFIRNLKHMWCPLDSILLDYKNADWPQ